VRNTLASIFAATSILPVYGQAGSPTAAPATGFWFTSGTPAAPGKSALCGAAFVQSYSRLAITTDFCVQGLDKFEVTAPDGNKVAVQVVSISRTFGVAVLKADADFPTFPLASDEAKTGDSILAAYPPGSDLGSYQIQVVREATMNYADFFAMKSDAPGLYPGAPLFDKSGAIVGIGALMLTSPTQPKEVQLIGAGVLTLRSAMDDVATTGYIRPPISLGLKMQDLSPQLAAAFKLQGVQGAVLSSVSPESQADGLRVEDIITALNGVPVTGAASFRSLLQQHHVGDTLRFTLIRNGEALAVEMKAHTANDLKR
jgi:serine protease DegQ